MVNDDQTTIAASIADARASGYAEARAEIDRYRAALEKIADGACDLKYIGTGEYVPDGACSDIARAALASTATKEPQ